MRGGDVEARMRLGNSRDRRLLVRRVGVGMQEVDHDRFRSELHEALGRGADAGLIERREHPALRIYALGYLEPQLAVDQGLEAAGHAVGVGPRAASELEHVAKAARRDEACLRTLALENHIRRHRRPVPEEADLAGIDAVGREDLAQTQANRFGGIRRGRGHLVIENPAARAVEYGEVGEGAADVYADSDHISIVSRRPRDQDCGFAFSITCDRVFLM